MKEYPKTRDEVNDRTLARAGNVCDACNQMLFPGATLTTFFYDPAQWRRLELAFALCPTCVTHWSMCWATPGDFRAGIPAVLINRGVWGEFHRKANEPADPPGGRKKDPQS